MCKDNSHYNSPRFEKEYGIAIQQTEVHSSGFTGHEHAVTVLTFIISGAAGALLKNLSDNLWKKLKKVARSFFTAEKKPQQSQITVLVRVQLVTVTATKSGLTLLAEHDIVVQLLQI